ncbi:hypothetical protein ABZ606_30965 [Streptomyces sp. NPDC012461]|uniref:hypothetical protein n=1 Tax=Streptomyces sp. NPDC012461 TaxID=3155117 RepID=UPI0033DB251D
MPPKGYHVVRRHIRRNPRPSTKKLSGWTIAGLVAGVWLWGQVFGFDGGEPEQSVQPQPSASVPAQR